MELYIFYEPSRIYLLQKRTVRTIYAGLLANLFFKTLARIFDIIYSLPQEQPRSQGAFPKPWKSALGTRLPQERIMGQRVDLRASAEICEFQ